MNKKIVIILIISLIFVIGSDRWGLNAVKRNSGNFEYYHPVSYAVDRNISTWSKLLEGEENGWFEQDFGEKRILVGFSIDAKVSSQAWVHLKFEINGIKYVIPSSYISDFNERLYINIKEENIITDSIAVVLQGPGADSVEIREIDFIFLEPENSLIQADLELLESNDEIPFYYDPSFLIDGNTGTIRDISYYGIEKDGGSLPDYYVSQCAYDEFTEEAGRYRGFADLNDSIEFIIKEPGNFSGFSWYTNRKTSGTLKFYGFFDGNQKLIETASLSDLIGWNNIAFDNEEIFDKIGIDIYSDAVYPAVIGEIKLWGVEKNKEPGIREIINFKKMGERGTGVFICDSDNINESYMLQLIIDQQDTVDPEKIPVVKLNGFNLFDPKIDVKNGVGTFSYLIDSEQLIEESNFLEIHVQDGERILTAVLTNQDDSICYHEIQNSGNSVRKELGETFFVKRAAAYSYEKVPLNLNFIGLDGKIGQDEMVVRSNGDGSVKIYDFQIPVKIDSVEILNVEKDVGIILYGDRCEQERHLNIYNNAVVNGNNEELIILGTVDESAVMVELNNKPAKILGNNFWLPLVEIESVTEGIKSIEAEAFYDDGYSLSKKIEMLISLPGKSFYLDQPDSLIYTKERVFMVSGVIGNPDSKVIVNGIEAKNLNRMFCCNVELEEGLNFITVESKNKLNDNPDSVKILRVYLIPEVFRIIVERPVCNEFMSAVNVVVSGYLEGVVKPEYVKINGDNVELNNNCFYGVVRLEGKKEKIVISAGDEYQGEIEKEIIVFLDTEPPELSGVFPEDNLVTSDRYININGEVKDEISPSVFVNGRPADIMNGFFSIELELSEGENKISLSAMDIAGNISVHPEINIILDTIPPEDFQVKTDVKDWTNNSRPIITFSTEDNGSGISHFEISIDENPFLQQKSPFRTPIIPDGEKTIRVRAVDYAGNFRESVALVKIDTLPPDTPDTFRGIPGNNNGILSWSEKDDETVGYILFFEENLSKNSIDISRSSGRKDEANGYQYFSIDPKEYPDFPGIMMENGKEYEFSITAVDRAGNMSIPGKVKITPGGIINQYDYVNGTVVEYEKIKLVVGAEAAENISEIVVSESISEELEEFSDFPLIGPIYDFSVINESGNPEDHIEFEKDFFCRIEYEEELVPEGFPEQNLSVYYFEPQWSRWFKVEKCLVDTDNNQIIFATDHFTEFSIQPTLIEDLSPAEMASIKYPPFESGTKHAEVHVSPNGGGIITSMTEFSLPGKNGLDLDIRRMYDTGTAKGDASGLSANLSVNIGDLIDGGIAIAQIGKSFAMGAIEQLADSLESYLKNNGDYAYSLGQGWRINLPYMKTGASSIYVRTFSGSYHNINSMEINKEKSKSVGAVREMCFENHEGEDFTLVVKQVFAPINKDTVINILSGNRAVNAWITMESKLIATNGKTARFDSLGRIIEITDTNENRIEFNYTGLILDFIKDSMGRIVRFEYNDILDTYCVPQIKRIWIENDEMGREVSYKYDNSGITGLTVPLPLLSEAVDVGGRKYSYEYKDIFLFSGNLGVKVNGASLIADLLTGGAFSTVASKFGFSSITVHTGAQCLWTFPLNSATGWCLGENRIGYKKKTLENIDMEFTDYFFGLFPTAADLTVNMKQLFYTEQLKYLDIITGIERLEDWEFYFRYAGKKQFICSKSVLDDGIKTTTTEYSKVKKVRPRWATFGDYFAEILSGNILTRSPKVFEYFSLESRKTVAESDTGNPISIQETEWNLYNLRPEEITQSGGGEPFRYIHRLYDQWGNNTCETVRNGIGERATIKKTYNAYNEAFISEISEKSEGFLQAPFSQNVSEIPYVYDRVFYSLVENGIPAVGGRAGRTEYINKSWRYDKSGNEIEYAVFDGQAGQWAVTEYIRNGAGECVRTISPEGHVKKIEYDYLTSSEYYMIIETEKDVLQGDGSRSDWIITTIHDYDTGFLKWIKNGEGWVTGYGYDRTGRKTEVVLPDLNDDAQWNPVEFKTPVYRMDNPSTLIKYDDMENRIEVFKPSGAVEKYTYNDSGNVIEKTAGSINGNEKITVLLSYNEYGEITSTTDPMGNTIEYSYEPSGHLRKITYPVIRGERSEINFQYDYEKLQRKIIDENGIMSIDVLDPDGKLLMKSDYSENMMKIRSTEFIYDSIGNLTAEKDGNDNWIYYEYNSLGLLIKTIYPKWIFFSGKEHIETEPVEQMEYDLAGFKTRELRSFNGKEAVIEYGCNGIGNMISIKTLTSAVSFESGEYSKPVDKEESYIYDSSGNKIKIIDPEKNEIIRIWSPTGKLLSETDQAGNKVTRTYDSMDRLVSMTDEYGNSGKYTEYDFTVEYEYDIFNRIVKVLLPKTRSLSAKPEVLFEYDNGGNLVKRIESDGEVFEYEWDERMRLTRSIHTDIDETEKLETLYNHDHTGNLLSKILPGGITLRYEYDSQRRLIGESEDGCTWHRYRYDGNNNLIEHKEPGGGGCTEISYTPYNLPWMEIDQEGKVLFREYDEDRNLTGLTDCIGNVIRTIYDETGNPLVEYNSRGRKTIRGYDNRGNLERELDPRGTLFTYQYNSRNLPELITAEKNGITENISYVYDEAGAIVQKSNEAAVQRYNQINSSYIPSPYGLIYQKEESTQMISNTVEYKYDSRNRMTGIRYPSGNSVEYEYDRLNRITGIPDFIDTLKYGKTNRLENAVYNNGIVQSGSYDQIGRLKNLAYSNEEGILKEFFHDYDDNGNIIRMNSNYYSYDKKHQLISASLSGEESQMELEYIGEPMIMVSGPDPLGKEKMEYLDIEEPENERRLDWRAGSIGMDLGYGFRIKKFEVKPENDEDTRVSIENTAVYISLYNQQGSWGDPVEYQLEKNTETGELCFILTDTVFGRYIKIHSHYNEMISTGVPVAESSQFLLKRKNPFDVIHVSNGRNEFYAYDGAGNRTLKTCFTLDYENRIYSNYTDTNLLKTDGLFAYRYDANGNLIEKGNKYLINGDEVEIIPEDDYTEYEYDLFNRLTCLKKYVKTINEVEKICEYVYNVNGYRIMKVTSDRTYLYFHDERGRVLEEKILNSGFKSDSIPDLENDSEISSRDYVYLDSYHIGYIQYNEKFYYGTDYLGSTVLLTDQTGVPVWTGALTPFADGETHDGLEEAVKFTGKDYDFDSGLFYFNARWYDPQIGRFITEDPARDGTNWYVYASNNPLRFVDPSGLEIIPQFSLYNMSIHPDIVKTGNSTTELFNRSGCYPTAFGNLKGSLDLRNYNSPSMPINPTSDVGINNMNDIFNKDSAEMFGREKPMNKVFGVGNWDYWTREIQGIEGIKERIQGYSDSDDPVMIMGIFDLSGANETITNHMLGISGIPDENGVFNSDSLTISSSGDSYRLSNEIMKNEYNIDNLKEIRIVNVGQ